MEKKVTLLRSQVLSTCTQSLIKDLSRPHRTYCMVKTNITMFIRMFFYPYKYNIKQIILVKSVLNAVNSCSITTVCIYRKSQFCRYWRLMFAQVCTAQLYTTTHKYDHIHLTLAGRPGSLLVKTHIIAESMVWFQTWNLLQVLLSVSPCFLSTFSCQIKANMPNTAKKKKKKLH